MFNATLAGHHHHHLRPDYLSNSRGSSRAGSRFDIHEAGRGAECRVLNPGELEERVQMLHDGQGEFCPGEEKSCYSKYQACLYLTVVFSIIAATIVIIVYVALGGLRGGGSSAGQKGSFKKGPSAHR